MKNKFTPELIAKAQQTKSVEELLTLAEENGITLTEDEAREYFEQLNQSGELSDDELDSVAGGGCGSSKKKLPQVNSSDLCGNFKCNRCGGSSFPQSTHQCFGARMVMTNCCACCSYHLFSDNNVYQCNF
ncbi:MAG: hypothetical protein K2J71_10475 [Oscillospiraceae bacterium]|nr:hypothetical protein [Oscillospiraceae bacterium]